MEDALAPKKGHDALFPNYKPKKGREAYLAAKKELEEAQHSSHEDSGTDGPRPGEDETWTMEEAWEDHTKELARVMTEAAPDFASGPAVCEVALGAPAKWWNDVVVPRLARIASSSFAGLDLSHADLRVIDVGTGSGTMLPHLTAALPAGVDTTIIALDVCEAMLDIVEERFPEIPLLNADFSALTPQDIHPVLNPDDSEGAEASPAEMAASGNGKVDVIVMNSVYSLMLDENDALEAAGRMLRRGGRLVISHPLGRSFVGDLKQKVPDLIEHNLPTPEHLDKVIKYLPFKRSAEFVDEEELYIALLHRTPEHVLENVLCMRGTVASGWGRGGKKLGVPTANLPESLFPAQLRDVPTGVYVGWASVADSGEAIKAVVNVGYSPTFVGAENPEKVVEAHLFKEFTEDFYDKEMRLMLTGYLRPEAKFAAFPLLLAAIQQDLGDAKMCLDQERFAVLANHPFLAPNSGLDEWSEAPYDAAILASTK